MIATYLGPVNPDNACASQHLYRLDPPIVVRHFWDDTPDQVYAYVVASELHSPQIGTETETYLFGSDENGVIRRFSELPGSERGILDHAQAIRNAGYTIEETQP